MRGSGHPQLEVRRTMIPLEARWSFNKAPNRGSIWKIRSESKSSGGLGEGRRLPRHATVLRRVREPRQKSDESLRADVNKNVSDDPDRLLARPVVSHIASIPYPASTLRECFCPRSRKTSSAAAPVGQLACRPRATVRNANARLEFCAGSARRKGRGLRDV